MGKAKVIMIAIFLIVGLSACGNNTISDSNMESDSSMPALVESAAQEKPIEESQDAGNNSEKTDETVEPLSGTLFVKPPKVEHPLADELLSIVSGFSWEFLFPEFEDVKSMDFYDSSVSSNLRLATYLQNDRLLAKGSGVTEEKSRELGGAVVVRYDDMMAIGRFYFGDDFSFQKGANGYEIGPLDDDSKYYGTKLDKGRGGMGRTLYFLTSVSEHEDSVIATFLPYNPLVNWGNSTIETIAFTDSKNSFLWSYDFGKLEYPDEETQMGTATGAVDCLDYYYLFVPQETLGMITVTFQRAEDGRMIATSCCYN